MTVTLITPLPATRHVQSRYVLLCQNTRYNKHKHIMETTHSSRGHILTVNAGSSSIKMALFAAHDPSHKVFEAAITNIGQPSPSLAVREVAESVIAPDHAVAAQVLWQKVLDEDVAEPIRAIGHRVVHGGPDYYETHIVTDNLIAELQKLVAFDAVHLPAELKLIEAFQLLLPDVPQFVCFDTAFHHDLPRRAQLLPIPRRFAAAGVRRYGFHGLSYAYIYEELRRVEGDVAARGKVIIAHLGSGASLTALHDGRSIDTTMSMTPASGIPMSTRSGDLDPGLMLYLARTQGYDAAKLNHMANFESGLLGISETTADMEQLLKVESEDARAKDAVDIFCYHVTKSIGALAAALGGLTTLVFTGGMGENAPKIRARICENLGFLGIEIDDVRNQAGERLISADGSRAGVHVIHTDEAVTIARETARHIKELKTKGSHESDKR